MLKDNQNHQLISGSPGLSSIKFLPSLPLSKVISSGNKQPNGNASVNESTVTCGIKQNDESINSNYPVCHENKVAKQDGIKCNNCDNWFHGNCIKMNIETLNVTKSQSTPWHCLRCKSILANHVKWGDVIGERVIANKVNSAYDEITKWNKNFFCLPRGKIGTEFIKELTKLFRLFNEKDKKWPSKRSKAKDNNKYLQKRLIWWLNGNLLSLMREAKEIQKRLLKDLTSRKEAKEKAFCRLMLLGKVGQAMRFIDNEDQTLEVHQLSDQIVDLLKIKHPSAQPIDPTILIQPNLNEPEPVIFEAINGLMVYNTAKLLKGSGGPTQVDAENWEQILCSRSHGKHAMELCDEVANLTKILCTETVHTDCLKEFTNCRLIPLDKGDDKFGNPGVRLVGVGEVLRRLTGKLMIKTIKDDIVNSAGPLQTCAGLQSGIEASIHLMKKIFQDEGTEGVLLVDADNAFNILNRKTAIKNIKNLCPSFHQYLDNSYKNLSTLYLNDVKNEKYRQILSEEGSTQGDIAAMAMYALATRPLLDELTRSVAYDQCKQVWYADDSSCGGKIVEMKKWWDKLNIEGPKYGYYPKPSKTILIVKEDI